MTQHPVALAIALAFAASLTLAGCDRSARLTEQEHIERAKDFEDKGNPRGSVVELKNAIQKNPDNAQARLLLGQVYLKLDMGAEAEKELTQAVRLGVGRESVKPQLGEALLLMGEYARVLDEIEAGDQTSPLNLARILQIRADAMRRQGNAADACKLYQQSLDISPDNPATYWGLAQCALAGRDPEQAREWLDAALKVPDRQARTWIYVGDLAQIRHDNEGALTAYASALKLEPRNPEALQNRATTCIKMDRMDAARADIETLRKHFPQSLAVHYLQAMYHYKEKKYPEARSALQDALKIAPDALPALLLGGHIEFALGNLQTAELHLNKVARVAPENSAALKVLAATQLRLGRPEDAEKTLAPVDFASTADAGFYTIAGEIALAKQDYAGASRLFETAVKLKPDSPTIRTELGLARLAQGDERALADLQSAADMEDASSRADTLIILSHISQRRYDDALASIAALEKKQPDSPMVWTYRGTAYLGKNDSARARDSFEQALKRDPKFFPAADSLARLDLAAGQPARARKRYESILKTEPNHLQAMLSLASLSQAEQDKAAQTGWLERAAKAHPRALQPYAGLAGLRLAHGDVNGALAIAREAVNANPDDPEALNLLASTQLTTGDIVNAITTYTLASRKASRSPDAFMRLAMAQVANRDLAAARVSLQKALQLKPDHLQSQDALLSLELSDKKPEAALRIARQIQTQFPDLALGYDREGDVHLDQKRLPQAIQSYETSQAKGAGSAGLTKLHRAHILAGNTQAAAQRLNDWLKQHPDDMAVRSHAAEYYMFAGRIQDAIAQYEAIQRHHPDHALVLNNLASLYQRQQDPRALATAEQALKRAPDNPAIQDTAGWLLVEQGQLARGLELLAKAAAAAPGAGTIRYHHAVALARSGKREAARQELEYVLREFPQLPAADANAARQLLRNL